MSVLRQANLLGQSRLDVPHVRAIESSICNDFDLLAGNIMAGVKPFVVNGFFVTTSTGIDASQTTISVAGAVIIHPLASESGSIFSSAAGRTTETLNSTNPRVSGSFTANAVNFVGIDLRRSADSSTSDLVQFLDPNQDSEAPATVPLARTLDYIIVISTQDFSSTPGIAPLAKITTDVNNNVTAVIDARDMMWRLGSGGSVANSLAAYAWPGGRTEAGDNSDFSVADKEISSLRDWTRAIMTRLWELGGGEHWYSSTEDRNVKMSRSGSIFSNGDWFSWDGTNLLWQGLTFIFNNSTAVTNTVNDQTSPSAGLTDLADGDCVYVDVNRAVDGSALQPVKTASRFLGTPTIPGSRFVIAWRIGANIITRDAQFPVNASFTVATTTTTGVVKLHHVATTPSSPIVLSDGDLNVANGVVGLNANSQISVTSTLGTAATFHASVGSATGIDVTSGPGVGAIALKATGDPSVVAIGVQASVLQPGSKGLSALWPFGGSGNGSGWYTDWMGFPTARMVMWQETWNVTSVGSMTDFRSEVGGNGAAAITIGGAGSGVYDIPGIELSCTTSSTSNFSTLIRLNRTSTFRAGQIIAFDFDIMQPSGFSYTANSTIIAGLSNYGGTGWLSNANATNHCWFRWAGSGNWLCDTYDGGTVNSQDSGVAPVNNTYQSLRIEYVNDVSAFGTPLVLFYINGAMVATSNAHLPTVGEAVYPSFGITSNVSSGSTTLPVQIGLLRYVGTIS